MKVRNARLRHGHAVGHVRETFSNAVDRFPDLKPGEARHVELTLDRRAFSFYDVTKSDWSAEPGDFTLLVGGSSDNIQLRSTFTLTR